jgi:hypothetical protein
MKEPAGACARIAMGIHAPARSASAMIAAAAKRRRQKPIASMDLAARRKTLRPTPHARVTAANAKTAMIAVALAKCAIEISAIAAASSQVFYGFRDRGR